jgi:UDP-GlcNAc3NAcA epimerase
MATTLLSMKIITILGARPQFIKASAFSRALQDFPQLQEVIVHTGQHYDENMSDIFFDELSIPKPHYHLQIGSGSHGQQTGKMVEKIEEVLLHEKPDWVLVYGDTNSTLAGALAASKLHIPVAHIEAGLRSFNKKMPEEINRILTDHCSTLLFAPTDIAVKNLYNEGIAESSICKTGDIMYDTALYFKGQSNKESKILKKLHLLPQKYILATIHRAENTDHSHRLLAIFEAFQALTSDIAVVLPLHPRTKKYLQLYGIDIHHLPANLHLIEPIGYLDMVQLESNATLIVTDSGGVQKEAFFYNVPCVTLRDETEWMELVEIGWNCLTPPTNKDLVIKAINNFIKYPPQPSKNPYGDGKTAKKIIQLLLQYSDKVA